MTKMTSIAFEITFVKIKKNNVAMRKKIRLITFVLKLFDVFCFRVILAKSSLFFKVYSFKLLLLFEMHVHETGKLYILKKNLLNGRSRHFF